MMNADTCTECPSNFSSAKHQCAHCSKIIPYDTEYWVLIGPPGLCMKAFLTYWDEEGMKPDWTYFTKSFWIIKKCKEKTCLGKGRNTELTYCQSCVAPDMLHEGTWLLEIRTQPEDLYY